MKCPKCGMENDADAVFCVTCREPLRRPDLYSPTSTQRSPAGVIVAGVILAIVVAVILILAFYSDLDDEGISTGTIQINLVNPYFIGALPCDFLVELDGELVQNGTIEVGESIFIGRNLTFEGSETSVVVHVTVVGSTTQPDDKTVTVGSGETKTVTFVLRMTME